MLRFDLMLLYEHALALIRANLEQVQAGNRVRFVVIGALTDAQLAAINDARRAQGYRAGSDLQRHGRRIGGDCDAGHDSRRKPEHAVRPLQKCRA
jgi:hypothetical protein